MSLINVSNLTFSYDGGYKKVFDNVSFSLDTDWKLGFVGRNGRGKTTFLNLLMGKYAYGGSITASVRFTYFPFHVSDKHLSVSEILCGICPQAEEWEILRELSYLQMDADAYYDRFSHLSSGEQTKVLLAGLFLKEGNFLLIDEPTNHLDVAARRIVSDYLKRKKGFILVSHDRAFLDGCVDHILSINKSDIEVSAGNFSVWYENFKRKQAYERTQNEKLEKDIARLSESAASTASWADKTEASKFGKTSFGLKPDKGYVGHKAAKMMKSAKNSEARKLGAADKKRGLLLNAEYDEKLKLAPLTHRSERLVEFSGVQISYDGKIVCPPLYFEIMRGERVALTGKNGCGKSSIMRLIVGCDIAHTGTVSLASGLIVSYIPQTFAGLKGSLGEFARENGLDESLFKAVLHKTGFIKDDFDVDISSFSQGQKKKVLIARSFCQKAHLYVWDEPLNYIDLYSRVQIEEAVREFCPAVIFAEHDKAFCDSIATKVIVVGT